MDSTVITAGVVLYQSATYSLEKYLTLFFDSLVQQEYKKIEIFVLENGSKNNSYVEELRTHYPTIRFFLSATNRGFGGGHNFLIQQSKAPYYLVLNPDMYLPRDFVQDLVKSLERHPEAAVLTGKIYHWENQESPPKSKTIDTVGLGITKSHRFYNLGEGEQDAGQFAEEREVFGASGSCMLLQRGALEAIKYEQEYFDEAMFMYKEDIDLCYRLQWAGYKSYYCPKAVAYHARTVGLGQKKSEQLQRWSYLNEKILLYKNRDKRFPLSVRCGTMLRQWGKKLYALFFARYLLEEDKKFKELLPVLQKKKDVLIKKVSVRELIKWMI